MDKLSEEQLILAKKQEEEIFKLLENKLKNDKDFAQEYKNLSLFYTKKIIQQAKNSEQRESFIEMMENTITQQIFHGYYLMSLLDKDLQNNPENIEDYLLTFKIPKGMLRIEMTNVMNRAFLNHDDRWYMNTAVSQYNTYLLRESPEIYELYQSLLREIACYGAYVYVTDHELYAPEENSEEVIFLLGYPLDLKFVNPQIFLKASYYSEEHEIWDAFKISDGKTEEKWVGTVHISAIPVILPENKKKTHYIINFSLSIDIREEERNQIMYNLHQILPDEIKIDAEYRVYTVNNVDIVTFNQ